MFSYYFLVLLFPVFKYHFNSCPFSSALYQSFKMLEKFQVKHAAHVFAARHQQEVHVGVRV